MIECLVGVTNNRGLAVLEVMAAQSRRWAAGGLPPREQRLSQTCLIITARKNAIFYQFTAIYLHTFQRRRDNTNG